jgi:hypothetical protein
MEDVVLGAFLVIEYDLQCDASAAAFNAPLAGAFYAFELIIGSYRWRRWRRSSPLWWPARCSRATRFSCSTTTSTPTPDITINILCTTGTSKTSARQEFVARLGSRVFE